MDSNPTFTAFYGLKLVGSGPLDRVLPDVKAIIDKHGALGKNVEAQIAIFDDDTGKRSDFDFRGSLAEVVARSLPMPRSGPGRPRLGVVAREVSLLPRHWDWLAMQPRGASATIRRLIDDARKTGEAETAQRIDALGRVMMSVGGDLPGFEEAYRALYARDFELFQRETASWPGELRAYLLGRWPAGT